MTAYDLNHGTKISKKSNICFPSKYTRWYLHYFYLKSVSDFIQFTDKIFSLDVYPLENLYTCFPIKKIRCISIITSESDYQKQ